MALFRETCSVCMCDRQTSDRPTALNEVSVENIRHSFMQSPRKYLVYNVLRYLSIIWVARLLEYPVY